MTTTITPIKTKIALPNNFFFLILYRQADNHRKINLETCIKYLRKQFTNASIVIAEQDINKKINDKFIDDYKCEYYFLYNPYCFNKGWAINCIIKNFKSDTNTFCMLDSDMIIIDPRCVSKALTLLSKNKVKGVNLIGKLFKMNKNNTRRFIQTNCANVFRKDITDRSEFFGGGAVIFDTKFFLHYGGYIEYKSWGGEDNYIEIVYKKLKQNTTVNGKFLHMYHPERNAANYNKQNHLAQIRHLKLLSTYSYHNIKKYALDAMKRRGKLNKFKIN